MAQQGPGLDITLRIRGFSFFKRRIKEVNGWETHHNSSYQELLAKARATTPSNEAGVNTQARFVRTEESDTWEFSTDWDDNFMERVKEATELAKNPLGRALMEKELLRRFERCSTGNELTGGVLGPDNGSSGGTLMCN